MARFAFQHHVLQHAVAIAVHFRIGKPGAQHQLALERSALLRPGAYIIHQLPAGDILRHRLAVEEDQGNIRFLRLIHQHRRSGAVHDIHAQYVTVLADETVHLLQLGGLVAAAVHHGKADLDLTLLLFLPGQAFQVPHQGGNKGVVLSVHGHAHPQHRRFVTAGAAAGQSQQQRQAQKQAQQATT